MQGEEILEGLVWGPRLLRALLPVALLVLLALVPRGARPGKGSWRSPGVLAAAGLLLCFGYHALLGVSILRAVEDVRLLGPKLTPRDLAFAETLFLADSLVAWLALGTSMAAAGAAAGFPGGRPWRSRAVLAALAAAAAVPVLAFGVPWRYAAMAAALLAFPLAAVALARRVGPWFRARRAPEGDAEEALRPEVAGLGLLLLASSAMVAASLGLLPLEAFLEGRPPGSGTASEMTLGFVLPWLARAALPLAAGIAGGFFALHAGWQLVLPRGGADGDGGPGTDPVLH